MRIRLIGLAVVGALGSLASACSSSPPNPYATVTEYCAAYAKAICQIGTTSCQFDVDGCQNYQASQCSTAAAQATASGTRVYTSSNVQACINQLDGAYGGGPSTITAATLTSIQNTCALVFVGSAGTGAACQSTGDCSVSGEICATAPGQTAKCEQPTQKTIGAQCLDVGDQCPTNSYCSTVQGASSYGTCVAAQSSGQPCSDTAPCDGADKCVAGTCQALGTQGAPCGTNTDCVSGLFCDTFTDTVTPTPACVTAYTFARGAVDCLGIEGQSTNGMVPEGGTSEGGGMAEGGEGGMDGGSD
jgi:hypothetical protein